ncbi:MAG: energy transducer TonB [Panacibacter sp.]
MKGKYSLIAISIGVMLMLNACETPEERAKENMANDAVNATDMSSSDTTASDTASVTMQSNTGETGATTPPTKKGTASVGKDDTNNTNTKMEADKNGIYERAEIMPSYPGGENALEKFVEDNLQYPQEAIDNNVEGKIMISFDVDETGKIYRPMVVSSKLGYGLEEAALKVVKEMPQWNPGKMKGKNVKTKFTLPIVYQLL